MVKSKDLKLTHTILALILGVALFPLGASKTYIGPPVLKADVKIIESAGVDKSQPDSSLPAKTVDSHGEYIFVKIDLSNLPTIDEIFITYTCLRFHIDGWSGTGVAGYTSVATHFCGDSSWSASTLTWNNKPDHREEWTDSWGFSMLYYGPPSLVFSIDEDAEEALRSGSKTLTEVITWGSGTGGAGLSSPSIQIEYAKRPVYKMEVETHYYDLPEAEAPSINTERMGNVVSMNVSDRTLWDNDAFYASPGTYALEFTGRCKFLGWTLEGEGIGISDPSQRSTEIAINSDGKLMPRCSFAWLIYGATQEEPERDLLGGFYAMSFNATQRYAESMEPLISGYLRLLRIYVAKNPADFLVQILGATKPTGPWTPPLFPQTEISAPIKVTPAGTGWLELDLTSQGIKLEKGNPFYISVTWLSDRKPELGTVSYCSEMGNICKLVNATEGWESYYETVLIEVIASTSLDEPVKFPAQVTTMTRRRSSTVTPTITTTSKPTASKETTTTTTSPSPTSPTKTIPPTITYETTVSPQETTSTYTSERTVTVTTTPPSGLTITSQQIILLCLVASCVVVAVIAVDIIKKRREAPPEIPWAPPPPSPPPI